MNYEKIVTLFDTAEHADAARRDLETAGFPPSEMSVVSKKTLAEAGQMLIFGRDIAQGEATELGGVILTVRVPERDAAKALGILNAHRVVDVKEPASGEVAKTFRSGV